VYAYAKNNNFADRWTQIQNENSMLGAVTGAIGGVVAGTTSGFIGGAGGESGTKGMGISGAIGGGISAALSGAANIYATSLENENRSEQLALNQNISQSQNMYNNLSLAQAVNKTMSIPVAIAPLNVKNTDLVGDKIVALSNTYREPDITRETAFLRWQHLGYPYGMRAHFTDYDNRVNYNVVTVDWLNKEHYIKESIFTWLENNLVQKSLFLFADEICLTLLKKLTGFYRLWHIVPSIDSGVIDAGIRASNIEHTLKAKIESGDLNQDGIAETKPFPYDNSLWWKRMSSDIILVNYEYLEPDGEKYLGLAIGPNAVNNDDTSRVTKMYWSPDGAVNVETVQIVVQNIAAIPYVSTDPNYSGFKITPSFIVNTGAYDPDNEEWETTIQVKLATDPSTNLHTTPTDVYTHMLGTVTLKFSWQDVDGNSFTKYIMIDFNPEDVVVKQLTDIASNDEVLKIHFYDYAKAWKPAFVDPGWGIAFEVVDPDTNVTHEAFSFHSRVAGKKHWYDNWWRGSIYCYSESSGQNHPISYWHKGGWDFHHNQWVDFLANSDGNDDNIVNHYDPVLPNWFQKWVSSGYHPEFPYARIYPTLFYYVESDGEISSITHTCARISSVEFGKWYGNGSSFTAITATSRVFSNTSQDAYHNESITVEVTEH